VACPNVAQIAEEKSHLHSFELAPFSTGPRVSKIRICDGPMPEVKGLSCQRDPAGSRADDDLHDSGSVRSVNETAMHENDILCRSN
jgi:hypothetical protein